MLSRRKVVLHLSELRIDLRSSCIEVNTDISDSDGIEVGITTPILYLRCFTLIYNSYFISYISNSQNNSVTFFEYITTLYTHFIIF